MAGAVVVVVVGEGGGGSVGGVVVNGTGTQAHWAYSSFCYHGCNSVLMQLAMSTQGNQACTYIRARGCCRDITLVRR